MLMSKAPLMTICRIVAAPFYKLFFQVKAAGLDNYRQLDRHQPLIIASNHHTHFDAVSIIVFINRNLHFLAKQELFKGHFGWFFRAIGLIEVNRDRHNSGVDAAMEYLNDNRAIAIFPEGTTKFKQPNQLLPFKYGAIKLAQQSGAPILPVAVTGRPQLFRGHLSQVRFGAPYYVSPNADIATATRELQLKIAELMRQSGVKNVETLSGIPAHNPSKEPPRLTGK